MRTRILMMFAIVTCVSAILMPGGCKKQEPAVPHEPEHTPEAMVGQVPSTEDVAAPAAAAVEQTNCPVMDGKINKDIFVEYKGKKVYFCCPMCVDQFSKDPEKYISKLPQFQN